MLPLLAAKAFACVVSIVGANIVTTCPAYAWVHGFASASTCPQGGAYLDGCPAALTTGFTNAGLRALMPHPPPWNIAGVDYPVGPASSQSYSDPTSGSLPTGCTYDGTNFRVTCSGSSAMVLDGWDFTLHNGVFIEFTGTGALTVRNSKMKTGTNCGGPINNGVAIDQAAGAGNITINNNDIDGGGVTGANCAVNGELIYLHGGGTQTVQYNRVHNTTQHFITSGGATSGVTGQLIDRYNYFDSCGFSQGEHCNGVQTIGGTYTSDIIAFNTYYNPQPTIALDAGGVTLPTGTFTNGSATVTAVAGLGTSSLAANMSVVPASPCDGATYTLTNGGAGSSNPNLTLSATYGGTTHTCSFEVPNAYPFGMVLPVNFTPAVNGGLVSGSIDHDTIISTGPIKGLSYAVACGARSGAPTSNTPVTISTNYADLTGAVGAFSTSTGYCSPTNADPTNYNGSATYSPANINIQTGATLTPPP